MSAEPITIATALWDANSASLHTSLCYDESWVEKLYRGFARNLTRPFRFVCFTEKPRTYAEAGIETEWIDGEPSYASLIQPFRLDVPMIVVGLDTIITGNCDELADYCFYGDRVAVPRDPFYPDKVCNGVVLAPAGNRGWLFDAHRAQNDMDWFRANASRVAIIDDLFPGQVSSFKGAVKKRGLGDTRICYFHGEMKPHELSHVGWIEREWR